MHSKLFIFYAHKHVHGIFLFELLVWIEEQELQTYLQQCQYLNDSY
jgi:hypothetical protein